MIKFKMDYNETSTNPEIIFEFNTDSNDLPEKMLRRFLEVSSDETQRIIIEESNPTPVTTVITLKTEIIPL